MIKIMNTVSDMLASFVHDLEFEDIPSDVIENAKLHLLDMLGVSAVGSSEPEILSILSIVRRIGGVPESSILWHGGKYPSPLAALVNGCMAHALDYDDTHLPSLLHLTSLLATTTLSVGEAVHASGDKVLTALVAGYEVTSRLGMAVRGKFHEKGFHATPVCGVFGAALSAGKLLGLNEEMLVGSLGIAGSFASGLMEFLSDGSWVKPLHVGWAAQAGIMAALIARNGVKGPKRIIEGDKGLYSSFIGFRPFLDPFLSELGKKWETTNISIKLFPNCHLIHVYMNACLTAMRKYNIKRDQIKEVECYVDKLAVPIICEPKERKQKPVTKYDAMFSLYHGVSTVLTKGWANIRDFDPSIGFEEEVLQLSRKINYEIKDEDNKILMIATINGEKLIITREETSSPEKHYFARAKFRNNMSQISTREKMNQIENTVKNLENLNDIQELLKLCSNSV